MNANQIEVGMEVARMFQFNATVTLDSSNRQELEYRKRRKKHTNSFTHIFFKGNQS